MKIAIAKENENVSAHFGHSPEFTLVEIEDGKLITQEKIANPGHQPGFLPQFLRDKGVKCVIAGGMGEHAMAIFERYNIQTILGVSGKIDEVLQKFLAGELKSGKSPCKPRTAKCGRKAQKKCKHHHGDH